MEELKNFKQFLREKLREKGLNAQKLAELLDISPKHLSQILEDSNDDLPAMPYVRGYLREIADVLDIDADELWAMYKKEYDLKSSGASDVLPKNRFASRPINKKLIIIVVAVLALLVYLIPAVSDFIGRPSLEIYSPLSDKVRTDQQIFYLKGWKTTTLGEVVEITSSKRNAFMAK